MGSVRYKSVKILIITVTFVFLLFLEQIVFFFIRFNIIIWCSDIFTGELWQKQKQLIQDDFRIMQRNRILLPRMILVLYVPKTKVSGQPSSLATIYSAAGARPFPFYFFEDEVS